jgi:hypothetical protein
MNFENDLEEFKNYLEYYKKQIDKYQGKIYQFEAKEIFYDLHNKKDAFEFKEEMFNYVNYRKTICSINGKIEILEWLIRRIESEKDTSC